MLRLLKSIIKKVLPWSVTQIPRRIQSMRPIEKRTCPMCGYHGWFGQTGIRPRLDAQCLQCRSLERHRLFYLGCERNQIAEDGQFLDPVIHFAPEKMLVPHIRSRCQDYKTADLFKAADLKLNLESLDLEGGSVGTIIANHVLEHVDDKQAAKEIYRVLKPSGLLVASVPIVEGWDTTYENPEVRTERDRLLHFAQEDHVRYYGRDFRQRIAAPGFRIKCEVTAEGPDVPKYGLIRGEKVFVFQK